MKVKFVSNQQAAGVSCGVLAHALDWAIYLHFGVHRTYFYWFVDVAEFTDWLRCLHHGFAVMSCGSHPAEMRHRYPFEVFLDDGSIYRVSVWFDEDIRGLRYGALVKE